MRGLLDLPYELLVSILNCLYPLDLVNFAASNSILANAAIDALRIHRKRRDLYQHLDLNACFLGMDQDSPLHPLTLVCDILQNEMIAHYPRTLSIRCWDLSGNRQCHVPHHWASNDKPSDHLKPAHKDANLRDRLLNQHEDKILSVLGEIELLTITGVGLRLPEGVSSRRGPMSRQQRQEWKTLPKTVELFDSLGHEDRGAALGLLLMLLPDLKIITLSDQDWQTPVWEAMADVLVGGRQYKETTPDGLGALSHCGGKGFHRRSHQALSKVSEVRVHGYPSRFCDADYVDQQYTALGTFCAFSMLPSVQTSSAVDVVSRSWGPGLSCQMGGPETIKLIRSLTRSATIENLLYACTRLKNFILVNQCWLSDLNELLDILAKSNARLSLENLSITGLNGVRKTMVTRVHPSIGSLLEFQALRSVRIPIHIYIDREIDVRPESIKHYTNNKRYRKQVYMNGVYKLSEILPTSIEHAEFDGKVDFRTVQELLEGFAQHKADRQPLLREIVFHAVDFGVMNQDLEKAAALKIALVEIGVVLELRSRTEQPSGPDDGSIVA